MAQPIFSPDVHEESPEHSALRFGLGGSQVVIDQGRDDPPDSPGLGLTGEVVRHLGTGVVQPHHKGFIQLRRFVENL